jgi:hypothetical protein
MNLPVGDFFFTKIARIVNIANIYAVRKVTLGRELRANAIAGNFAACHLATPLHLGSKSFVRLTFKA